MSYRNIQYKSIIDVLFQFRHFKQALFCNQLVKLALTFVFIFIIQIAFSQSTCVVQTRYYSNGLTVQSAATTPIESSADETCSLGVEMASASFYVSLTFSSNGAPKQLEGDLIFRFENKSVLQLPQALSAMNRVKNQQVAQYSYYIFEKFVNQILREKLESITYTLKGGEAKTIVINPSSRDLVKSGLICLNPLL